MGIAFAWLASLALWARLRAAARRGKDSATPAAVAAACAAGALLQATDPYFAILRAGRPITPSVQAWGLRIAIGIAIALPAIVRGAALLRPRANDLPPSPALETPLPWIATCVLLALLALAGSAALLDAQLLFLAGATIIWMRSGNAALQPGPLLTAAALGLVAGWGAGIASSITDELPSPLALALSAGALALAFAAALTAGSPSRSGLAAFLSITLGFGLPSISHAFVMLALQVPSIRASNLGAGLWIAGELTSGQPYRWGLTSLWPEAAATAIVAASLAISSGQAASRTIRTLAATACFSAGVTLLAFRMFSAIHP